MPANGRGGPHRGDPVASLGDRGAAAVEYALLLALIAVACLSAASFLGYATNGTLDDARTGMGGAGREFVCSPGRTPAPTPGWEAFWPDIYTCV